MHSKKNRELNWHPHGFVLFGTVAGFLVGLLDVWLGIRGIESPIAGESRRMLLWVSGSTLVLPGALVGLMVYFALISSRAIITFRWLIEKQSRRAILIIGIALLFGMAGLTGFFFYKRGIQVDAIDFTPLLLVTAAIAISFLGARFLKLRERISWMITIGFVGASLGVFLGSLPSLGSCKGVLPIINTRTVALSPVFKAVRLLYDGDRDGFASYVCESDCDCDDANPNINPIAVDVPDNGVDEDCSGADLVREHNASADNKRAPPIGNSLSTADVDKPLNIILITVDALRADHMHTYGYERKTTPNLDIFATSSALFYQVRSQGPSTRHSFPTLLTGRYFTSLTLKKGKKWSRLLPQNITFAEHLKEKRYKTLAIVPYFRFKEHSGLNQGFDVWKTVVDTERDPVWDPTADLVTDEGLSYLASLSSAKEPWMLWLHYFDPHGAYVKHPEQQSFGTSKVDRYDGELLYTDRHIQRLFDGIREKGLWDKIAIIVTSDHGEGFGRDIDHGFSYHGFSLFDSEIRIPLMILVPKGTPRAIRGSFGLIDIAPTILDLAGLAVPNEMHGVSLVPNLFGQSPPHPPVISELPGKRPLMSIVDWPHKLIWDIRNNSYSLYDLEKDPNELTDIAKNKLGIVTPLSNRLRLLRYDIKK